jgi:hypothetical protein
MNIIDYKQQVQQLPKSDAIDLEIFICQASRLASLGDKSLLTAWYEKPSNIDYLNYFLHRAKIAKWQFENFHGDALALSIIEAQDINCLLSFDKNQTSKRFIEKYDCLEEWITSAEECKDRLDDEASHLLTSFLAAFPITDTDRLVIIESPLGSTEKELIAELGKTKMLGYLNKLVPLETAGNFDFTAHLENLQMETGFELAPWGNEQIQLSLAAHDENAPMSLIEEFCKRHEASGHTGPNECIEAIASLESDWTIRINLKLPSSWNDCIEEITFDSLKLTPTQDEHDAAVWVTYRLKEFTDKQKRHLIEKNTSFIVRLKSKRMFKF